MASSLQYYTITITNSSSNSAPADGFVDNSRIENYYVGTTLGEAVPSGFTYLLAQAKRRGNIRYQEILRQLSLVANVTIDPNAIVGASGAAKVEPTSLVFQVLGYPTQFSTPDESNPGAYLTGAACLKRCVARALTAHLFTNVEIYNPTAAAPLFGGGGSPPSVSRTGTTLVNGFEVGPYSGNLAAAEALIAVVGPKP